MTVHVLADAAGDRLAPEAALRDARAELRNWLAWADRLDTGDADPDDLQAIAWQARRAARIALACLERVVA